MTDQTYLDEVAAMVAREVYTDPLGDAPPLFEGDPTSPATVEEWALYRLYALLALTTGESTSSRNVHDAWAAWTLQTGRKDHRSLIPFEDLSAEVAAMDDPYRDAIRRVARALWLSDLDHPLALIRRTLAAEFEPTTTVILGLYLDRADVLAAEVDREVTGHDGETAHDVAATAFAIRQQVARSRRTGRQFGAIPIRLPGLPNDVHLVVIVDETARDMVSILGTSGEVPARPDDDGSDLASGLSSFGLSNLPPIG